MDKQQVENLKGMLVELTAINKKYKNKYGKHVNQLEKDVAEDKESSMKTWFNVNLMIKAYKREMKKGGNKND